ncbi:MAG: DUF3014 domain-containing protein [Rubrivivax sp.]
MKSGSRAIVILLLLAIVGGIWWWLSKPTAVVAVPPPEPAPMAVTEAPSAPSMSGSEPDGAASGAAAPIVAAAPAAPLQEGEVDAALAELLGGKAALSQVQVDQFPRRLAATVDNLARSHAPVSVWPVAPAPGRFATTEQGGKQAIAAENFQRYDDMVAMFDRVDPAQAARLLHRMQPMLQSSYANLGFPDSKFQTRLIEVIDLLLATPEVTTPVYVTLTEVKGPIPSTRPWVRWRYADPKLEALPAGQKVLIRMGPANAQKVKAKLRAVRAELQKLPPAR